LIKDERASVYLNLLLNLNPSALASTEAFTGTFLYPGTNKKTSFGGVIYQKPTPSGFGLFLGPDQSGSLEIDQ
jgi:hypothetical protein